MRVRGGLARVPVEQGSAAVAARPPRVVPAVVAHAPADAAAGQVHVLVEVTAVGVAVAAAGCGRTGVVGTVEAGAFKGLSSPPVCSYSSYSVCFRNNEYFLN